MRDPCEQPDLCGCEADRCQWSDLIVTQCGHCLGHCVPLKERPGNWEQIVGGNP